MICSAIVRFFISLAFFAALSVALPCAAEQGGSNLEVLDLEGAALLLRVPPNVVREMAGTQRIPARSVGGVWRFSRTALLEWLKGGPVAAAPAASSGPVRSADRSEALTEGLAAISGRGARSQSAMSVELAAPDAQPPAGSSPPTIGKRPAVPTAEEVALRDQQVLLKRGAASVDFGASYSYSERSSLSIVRQEQRSYVANVTLRYGLLDNLQLTARAPWIQNRTTTFSDSTISGTAMPPATHGTYAGDASVSLLGVAWRESVGGPNVLFSIDSVVPSGPGDRGLGAGLVLSKSYDPTVIFAGLSYLHGFAIDPAKSRRTLAPTNIALNLGYTYALNDALALSTVFTGTYRSTRSPDGTSIPPSRERYQLQLGLTWLLAPGVFIEPAVAVGLGSDNPNLAILLNIPYSF